MDDQQNQNPTDPANPAPQADLGTPAAAPEQPTSAEPVAEPTPQQSDVPAEAPAQPEPAPTSMEGAVPAQGAATTSETCAKCGGPASGANCQNCLQDQANCTC